MSQRIAFRIWFISVVLSSVGVALGLIEFSFLLIGISLIVFLLAAMGTFPGWMLLWKVIDVCENKQVQGPKVVFIVLVAALVISALNFYGLMALFTAIPVFFRLVPIVLLAVTVSVLFSSKLLLNLQPHSHEN